MTFDTEDVRSALLPITLISWFVGMGVIEYPVGHQRTILGLLYPFLIYTIYAICAIFVSLEDEDITWDTDAPFKNILYFCYYGLYLVIVGLFIIGNIVCNKKRNRCIMELKDINGMIKEMGVVRSYKRLLVSQIWQFGTLVVTIIIMTSFRILSYFDTAESEEIMEISSVFYRIFFTQYPFFISTVNEIMFCNGNEIMTGSFEDLNTLLESLRVKHPYDSRDSGNNLVQVDAVLRDERKIEILYSVRKLYTRLVYVAKYWNQLNAVFTLTLVVFSIWVLTLRIFVIYTVISTAGILSLVQIFFVESVFLLIFLGWKLLMIVRSAVSLTTEAHRTCGIVLWHLHPIASLRPEVRTFSMQLTQNPLHLSVFGLCSLDYTMLQQIFANVITYSVMLIQTANSPAER